MLLLRLAHPLPLLATAGDDGPRRHYRPLNGRLLRDLALGKEHHGGGRFVNPFGYPRKGRFGQFLKWKASPNRFGSQLKFQQVVPIDVDWPAVRGRNGLSITFLKHAGLLINDAGSYLLVDPIFSDLAWFIDDFSPLAFDPRQIPQPDHVLITHGHFDHLDTPSLALLEKHTHVISPLGHDDVFRDLDMHNRTRLDWYEAHRDGGRTVTLMPTNHWTMRNPLRGPNRSLWGGYMIQSAAGPTIYLMGDSGYFDGFEQIGQDFDIDLAVINLGAYEPRWFMASSHMNPGEAVRAFKELNARRLMIVHWGTFRLGDEPVHFPPADLKRELEKQGLSGRLIDIRHGETFSIG